MDLSRVQLREHRQNATILLQEVSMLAQLRNDERVQGLLGMINSSLEVILLVIVAVMFCASIVAIVRTVLIVSNVI
jgi:hypothetical protein